MQWGAVRGAAGALRAHGLEDVLGPWLLLVSAFPLVQLDTPLHAELKAEIRDKVQDARAHLDAYYDEYGWPFVFFRDPATDGRAPLWNELKGDEPRMRKVYSDLAREAIRAEPVLYARLGLERFLGSVNPSEFSAGRFGVEFLPKRFEHFYDEAHEGERTPLRELFALPKTGPLPPYEEFRQRLAPEHDCWQARFFIGWSRAFGEHSDFITIPPRGPGDTAPMLLPPRLTLLGWWMVAALALSLLPRYFPHARRLDARQPELPRGRLPRDDHQCALLRCRLARAGRAGGAARGCAAGGDLEAAGRRGRVDRVDRLRA